MGTYLRRFFEFYLHIFGYEVEPNKPYIRKYINFFDTITLCLYLIVSIVNIFLSTPSDIFIISNIFLLIRTFFKNIKKLSIPIFAIGTNYEKFSLIAFVSALIYGFLVIIFVTIFAINTQFQIFAYVRFFAITNYILNFSFELKDILVDLTNAKEIFCSKVSK